MRLQIEVDAGTGLIRTRNFKPLVVVPLSRLLSLATEWLKRKTVDQALAIDNMDIAEELTLPPLRFIALSG